MALSPRLKSPRPSVVIVDTDPDGNHDVENKGKFIPQRRHSVDHTGDRLLIHPPLPEGSIAFQRVMMELNPQEQPMLMPEPRQMRRRRSSQVHVHYVTETVMENGHPVIKIKAETETEGEDLPESDRHILHGRCHCYFVRDGKVMGLADQKCNHEHRNHIYPLSSSTTTTLSTAQPSSPRRLSSASPPLSASSPDGSPSPRRKSTVSQQHHTAHLLTPGRDVFRARSHSDVSGLAKPNNRRNFSLASHSPASAMPQHGRRKMSEYSMSSSAGKGSPEIKLSHHSKTSSSFRHEEDAQGLSDQMNSTLRISEPPSILVQGGDSDQPFHPHGGVPRRKLSTHAVPTDKLHLLYDQLLPTEHA